jgi:hypothetical protein
MELRIKVKGDWREGEKRKDDRRIRDEQHERSERYSKRKAREN